MKLGVSEAPNIIEFKNVSKCYHDHPVLTDIHLEVKNGEFLTILGPSGCGKTTLLRLLSGFESPSSGTITMNGEDVSEQPPHLRHVNTVFQSYALFPHMNVYDNVAFGLRCKKYGEQEIQKRVREALRMVKLEGYMTRKPQQLSGGQQQRVAIARAVVNQPLILLLDEPLSSLDYRLRKTMQMELKQLQSQLGITFIMVTHDQEEALSTADRVIVMNEGMIEQVGTPREVYEEPANLHVAQFIGEVNIFTGEVLKADENTFEIELETLVFELNNTKGFEVGQRVHVLLRPEDLEVYSAKDYPGDPGPDERTYPATVLHAVYKGSTVDLSLRLNTGKKILATQFFNEDDQKLDFTPGESVFVSWRLGWEVVLPEEV